MHHHGSFSELRSIYKYWKFIWILLLTTACLPGGRELTGIWHAELEMVPGLRSALDIQLSQDITGKWSGRFELPELMAASELQAVNVQGSKIELNLGAGAVFKGELSEDKTAIRGVLDVPDQKPENVAFTKISHWSAQIPARAGKELEISASACNRRWLAGGAFA